MAISLFGRLDELLRFEDFRDLQAHQEDVARTFEALGLENGQRYLSIGIGRNKLPPFFALYGGIDVVGIDIDQRRVEYCNSLASKFKLLLEEANGSLNAYIFDIINGSKIEESICNFDIVECVNFTRRYNSRELAQILLSLGKEESAYLASLFGGVGGRENTLVHAIIAEAARNNKKYEVIADNLLVSDKYKDSRTALIKVY